jgi:hypothetical protein
MNVCGYCTISCGSSSPSPPPSNYLYNISSIGSTTQGSIPIYTGASLNETEVASEIRQSSTGITISHDLNVQDITSATFTSLNDTINNISGVIYNLTNIQTKV